MLLSTGTTLGRYRIIDQLRAGGMATLYLARRTGAAGFSKPVALKLVHAHLAADPEFVEMFVAEAKLAAQVEDPHVAHVEELGHEADTYFIAMEYVLGGSLAELATSLRQQARALSPTIVARIAADAARGLHAVHEATSSEGEPLAIVHRDVSPQNILISTKGIVKIIDLGVANTRKKARDQGSVVGKLAYMSPEQARGEEVDRRTDVYALGIVLWELLTSQRLFKTDAGNAMLQQARNPNIEPPSSRSSRPISPALEAVVMRALAVDPASRPPTAEALCEELLAAEPDARKVSTTELGAIVERALKPKVDRERGLLRSEKDIGPESSPSLSSPDDVLATCTVAIGDVPLTPALPPAGPRRWPLYLSGVVVAAALVILFVFGRAPASGSSSHDRASSASAHPPPPPAPPEPAPVQTVVEIFEPAAPAPPSASAPARVVRSKGKPPRRPALSPNGSTSIVHGTPLTTDVR